MPKPIYPRFPFPDHKAATLQSRRVAVLKALQKQSCGSTALSSTNA